MGDYVDYTDLIVTVDNDDMTYEDYGVSPSSDYRSPIENVEGKNKLDYKTVSNTPNTVVSLIENGFNVSGYYAGKVVINNLKKNTNYYLQYLTQNITGTAKYVAVFAGNSQTTVLKEITSGIGGVFNTGKNTEINIWFYGGRGADKIGEAKFTNIQLEEGTVATPYVPYNLLEIKDTGENLFNPNNVSEGYVSDASGNILSISGQNKNTGYIEIIGGEKYFILSNKLTGNWGAWYDKDKKFISGITLGGNSSGIVTAPNNAYFINFTVSYKNNNPDYANNVMIARSDKETPYKPYQEQKVTFPLENQKLMEGSYLASDGIHHTRKQVILNGGSNESWFVSTRQGTGYFGAYVRPDNKKNTDNDNLICDYFKHSEARSNVTENLIMSTNTAVTIIINNSIANSLDTLKSWLSENPITVEYELTTEEIVPYTEAQQEAWDKIESMKLYDGVNHIESTSEIDIKYNYIYKKPSIKNKSNIENKISSGEYQTIINNKRYFVFLEEELKSVRNDITDRLYIDTNKNIAKVMKRVDKLVLNGTEEWNVNTTHSNVFYTAKPKNMADNETNIFCTITDEFSKDLSGETYGILIDTNINIKIPKVKTVADLKAYLAKEPITIQYKAIEEIKDIILLSKPSSYWTTCEDEFKYPQMQKTTNKRGCVADVIGEEIDVFCKTNKEQFEKIATHKNSTGYAVNRIKKKKWKSIQLKFSSNKSFELFSCTLESYIGSYIKR